MDRFPFKDHAQGRTRVWLVLTLVATSALAMALAAWIPLREAPMILLFLPLLWGYTVLAPRGMVACGVAVALVRLVVECLAMRRMYGQWSLAAAAAEAAFPVILYVALGVAFYVVRRRQRLLMQRVLRDQTKEVSAELARRLAHDLNNVFTIICGTAEMLLRHEGADEQVLHDIEQVRQAGRRGVEMIREFREAREPAADRFEVADLSAVTREEADLIERLLPPGIRLVREWSDEPLPVRLNRSHFSRIFTNLCVNARQAMPNGGRLTLRTEHQTVGRKSYAVLSVSDTGVGMDEKTARRVFEPFFTTHSEHGGTGLGLSICQTLVQACGGYIDLMSEPGEGATVLVLLPVAPQGPVSTSEGKESLRIHMGAQDAELKG